MVRIDQHRRGKGAKYTKGKDLELVFFEMHLTRSAVMKREYEIKTFPSQKKWELITEFQSIMNREKKEE